MPDKITAEEISYLRWIHQHLDWIDLSELQDRFEHETDKRVPSKYDTLEAVRETV